MNTRIEKLIHYQSIIQVPDELKALPFGEVAWSWMGIARLELEKRAGDTLAQLSAEAHLTIEVSLAKRWTSLCVPTFYFLLDFERINLSLEGTSSKELYENFIKETFFTPQKLDCFFKEYGELARLVITYLDFWLEQVVEFLERFQNDLPLLRNKFGREINRIASLKMDAGDAHNRGRSVIILFFESSFGLVYKPKNLNIVRKFHSLIDWINTQQPNLLLKNYTVIPRGNYGWEEKVKQHPCVNLKEVEHYFQRCGMYLCLMYLLDGIDLHHENVIANGEHPMLIDLETLFATNIASNENESVNDFMQHSVLSTGLLPGMLMRKGVEKGVDISGLCYSEGGNRFVPRWKNLGTDEIQIGLIAVEISKKCNQVIRDGKVCLASDYVEEIVLGFNRFYDFIQTNRIQFEYWITQLENDPIRIVIRSTKLYVDLFNNLFDPLQVLNKDLFLKKLEILDFTHRKIDYPPVIINEEKRSLFEGDIPCFHTVASSKDLYSNNILIAKDCLQEVPAQRARVKLKQMNESDRKIQETFIRQSFSIRTMAVHEASSTNKIGTKSPSQKELLSKAIDIANEIRAKAFVSKDGSLGWIGLEPHLSADEHRLAPLNESLFSGRVGIALFFAALSKISGDPQWQLTALSTLKPLRKMISKGKDLTRTFGIGGMTGIGGFIYGLFQIGKLLDQQDLIEDAKTLIYSIEVNHIEEDGQYDFIFGSAGLILSLLSFHKHMALPLCLELANKCGEHICKMAVSMEEGGLSWKNNDKKPLLGFSHGNAGIAYALLKLNNQKFQATIQGALDYERAFFSEQEKNWPHLGLNSYRCAWCHGATGIGLARLFSQDLTQDLLMEDEITHALETTKKHLDKGGITLCCSLTGRLEFLKEASKRRLGLSEPIETTLKNIFAQIEAPSEGIYSANFMQGHAGLGYTLLRMLDKEEVLPQVLLLD